MPNTKQLNEHFSEEGLRRIVAKQLPAWKRACAASDAHIIVLHESAFGRSRSELLLLAYAIKVRGLEQQTYSSRMQQKRANNGIDVSKACIHSDVSGNRTSRNTRPESVERNNVHRSTAERLEAVNDKGQIEVAFVPPA